MADPIFATRDEVRAFDRYCIERLGIPGIVLMENAGRQIAEAARAMVRGAAGPRVLILAGRGNNGGDGYVAARHLALSGLPAETAVLAARSQIEGDADTNLRILEAMGLPVHVLAGPTDESVRQVRRLLATADLIIDGLLGTGARGEIREPYASAIAAVNETGKPVLAIDIPSGLDCDTGRPLGPTLRAAKTVTMAAPKIGFRNPEAAAYTGEVVVADIGAPYKRIVY
ncbi:MAG: NAD(P)H-hydrate epimerase [Planctomycetota bacterium]|nr:NAD(P)H-hydrate epimerase [Planctomycetota bacterium]